MRDRLADVWYWLHHPYRLVKGRKERKAFREAVMERLLVTYNELMDKEMESMFGGDPNHKMQGLDFYLRSEEQ